MSFFGDVNLAPIGIVIFKMYVHFKRDQLENQNYNYFNILLYLAILYLTSIPLFFFFFFFFFEKLHPLTLIAMVIFTNILEMH